MLQLQTPLPEQTNATDGIDMDLELMGTKELAFHITVFDWDLFWVVHEYELLYHTFGRHHFGKVRILSVALTFVNFNSFIYWVIQATRTILSR